ncbi:hypothetical protein ANO14919_072510 [Xylariales sp. No.14919]|nr:hypothetical protein ANO14919_072510 [Xylariales sp. No.14919]
MLTSKSPVIGLKFMGLASLLMLSVVAYSGRTKAGPGQTPLTHTPAVERECSPVDMYTIEWFLDQTKPGFEGSLCDTAMFYSRDMSRAARTVAPSLNKVTIWDVWPRELYDHENIISNPMRCIHRDPVQRQTFFENMSLAFAKKARGSAGVLHSSQYYREPPRDGIWAMIEEPELTRSEGPVEWLRKFRLHPEFPKLANLLSAAKPTQKCQAEAAWLRSSVGIEWLRSLRIEETVTQWSEVFWKRDRTARGRLPKSGHEGLRRRAQVPLQKVLPSYEASTKCQETDDFGFFDDIVNW